MQAGKLRHSVGIQNRTRTSDSKGGFTESWTTAETVWADIRPMLSREQWAALQVGADVTHYVTIRYTSNCTHESRILWGTRALNIVGIRNPDERNEYLQLVCKEDRT